MVSSGISDVVIASVHSEMAEKFDTEKKIPRLCGQKRNRGNVPVRVCRNTIGGVYLYWTIINSLKF